MKDKVSRLNDEEEDCPIFAKTLSDNIDTRNIQSKVKRKSQRYFDCKLMMKNLAGCV